MRSVEASSDQLRPDFAPYRLAARSGPPGRPWVLANMVAGLDGGVAVDGRVRGLSGPTDKALFVFLRSLADFVLVGAGTVRAERYGPVRLPTDLVDERRARGQQDAPTLVVVSASLRLDPDLPLLQGGSDRPVVVTCAASNHGRRRELEQVADVVVAGDLGVDLAVALGELAHRGAGTVLTEGGPLLLGELVTAGLLDELCLTIAPVVGGDQLGIVRFSTPQPLVGFTLVSAVEDDGHLFLRYLPERS